MVRFNELKWISSRNEHGSLTIKSVKYWETFVIETKKHFFGSYVISFGLLCFIFLPFSHVFRRKIWNFHFVISCCFLTLSWKKPQFGVLSVHNNQGKSTTLCVQIKTSLLLSINKLMYICFFPLPSPLSMLAGFP